MDMNLMKEKVGRLADAGRQVFMETAVLSKQPAVNYVVSADRAVFASLLLAAGLICRTHPVINIGVSLVAAAEMVRTHRARKAWQKTMTDGAGEPDAKQGVK